MSAPGAKGVQATTLLLASQTLLILVWEQMAMHVFQVGLLRVSILLARPMDQLETQEQMTIRFAFGLRVDLEVWQQDCMPLKPTDYLPRASRPRIKLGLNRKVEISVLL